MNLLGCSVSNRQFRTWSKILVYPFAPFFLTDDLKQSVPQSLCLSRAEFSATVRDLSFHDSYTTYNVGIEAKWVTFLSTREFRSFPEELRLELLLLQASLGRGQLYKFEGYKNLLRDSELEYARAYTFEYREKEILELNHTLWQSFSFETQTSWLAKFVSEDRMNCLSDTLSKKEWQAINRLYPAVKHLVGFVNLSGPNCFATTLAGLLDVEKAKGVSEFWLQSETFLRDIEKRRYRQSELAVNDDLPDGSILIWKNDNGFQHVCFYLGHGLVFNKDAQGWFAPRQLLRLETVLQTWQGENRQVEVWFDKRV